MPRIKFQQTTRLLKTKSFRLKGRLTREEDLLAALQRVSEVLTLETDLQRILAGIATIVGTAVGTNKVNFWQLTPNKKGLFIVAAYGMAPSYMKHSRQSPIPVGKAWIGRAVKTKKVWATSDILNDPRLHELLAIDPDWKEAIIKENYHALLCLPLFSRRAVIGGMCVYYPKVHQFSNLEMRLFYIVGNQAATAIANAQMLKDLRQSQVALEEIKNDLEIKVADRTRELKKFAKGLDEQVKEKTEEIQGRMKELEGFYKLAVGRELKMTELKEEVKRLKENLSKYQTEEYQEENK